jgi:hypothetical protein
LRAFGKRASNGPDVTPADQSDVLELIAATPPSTEMLHFKPAGEKKGKSLRKTLGNSL